MSRIALSIAIHDHQPVGNFDHVVEDAYRQAYFPLLETLSQFPSVPFGLHHSGPLIDWLERHHPEYLTRVRELVARGQVEVMGGAYEEPLLPLIPTHDARGQVLLMQERCVELFEQKPTGVWLAERIWEPSLASTLAPLGVKYTVLDDAHFLYAGLSQDELIGPFVTEDAALPLTVFPISKRLRYTIPFEDPESSLMFIDEVRARSSGDALLTFADDGEKFGVWPGTHDLCYNRGWLARFLEALLSRPDVELTTPGRAMQAFPPRGRVYLPAASYAEMLEWSLPARAIHDYEDFIKILEGRGEFERFGRFVRGGYPRNFLAKYGEVDHLHKRVWAVSERIHSRAARSGDDSVSEARRRLWRSQCNCPYWHGVFGGAYLPHLRRAVWSEMLAAERMISVLEGEDALVETPDLDLDGREELHLRTPSLIVHLAPALGGSIVELSLRDRDANLLDTFARREEGYHRKLVRAQESAGVHEDGSVPSIHDRVETKEEGLAELLAVDTYRRAGLVDHFFAPGTALDDFVAARFRELGDFSTSRFDGRVERSRKSLTLGASRRGRIEMPWGTSELTVVKKVQVPVGASRLDVGVSITNHDARALDLWYGSEWNWALLAPDADDRYYELDGRRLDSESRLRSRGVHEAVTRFGLVDGWRRIAIRFSLESPATLWRAPLETVSMSESGFERVFQAACTVVSWRFTIKPRASWHTTYTVSLEEP